MSINFAILTAGNIAEKMAATLSRMPQINCYAIAARSLERAEEMRKRYGFEKSYGSYEELFCDDSVDIIYIGSLHSQHFEHAKAALLHKKHVLCEKPITVNASQLKELYALADQNDVILCDATWTCYMPFVKALQAVLQSGEIGDAYFLDCSMGFCSSEYPRMSSPDTAGGALLDLGIYPLTMALIAFGDSSATIQGYCTKTPLGVDAQNAFTLRFESGRLASLKSSMVTLLDNTVTIYGTKGKLVIEKDFWCCEAFTVYTENGKREHLFPHSISGYEYEVYSLISAIERKESECRELPRARSIRVMEYLDTLRESWGLKYPFE